MLEGPKVSANARNFVNNSEIIYKRRGFDPAFVMKENYLQDFICARWCDFYHAEKQTKERCGSFKLLKSLNIYKAKKLLNEFQEFKKSRSKLDTFLYQIICESCDYLIDGCDYRDNNCDYKAPPCGGLLILRKYLSSGNLNNIEFLLKSQ